MFDCMDGLRSKGLATDQDVDRSSTETDPKAALKFLFMKLIKLSDGGLYYFVDEILPTLDNTEELLSTLQLCTGPTACPLKSSQSHCTQEGSMDAAGGVGGLKPEVAVRTLLLLYLFVGTYVCVAVRLFASVAWYVLSRVFVAVTLRAYADHCITGSFPAGSCSENSAVHNTIFFTGFVVLRLFVIGWQGTFLSAPRCIHRKVCNASTIGPWRENLTMALWQKLNLLPFEFMLMQ